MTTTKTEIILKSIQEIQEMISYQYPDQANELDYVRLHIQELEQDNKKKNNRIVELEEDNFNNNRRRL